MDFTKFKALLDDQMSWPDYYSFKFVVKTLNKSGLLDILTDSDHKLSERASKNGNYTSITCKKLVKSSDDVVAVYQKVSKIEGIISL